MVGVLEKGKDKRVFQVKRNSAKGRGASDWGGAGRKSGNSDET